MIFQQIEVGVLKKMGVGMFCALGGSFQRYGGGDVEKWRGGIWLAGAGIFLEKENGGVI